MRDSKPAADGERESRVGGPSDGGADSVGSERRPVVTDGGLPISTIIDALADRRRRLVLYYLQEEGEAELEDITEQVAVWETQTPAAEIDDRTRRRIRIDLYHAHMPKLADAGIIEYDRRHGSTCYQDPPEPVEQFLEYCAAIEIPEMHCQ